MAWRFLDEEKRKSFKPGDSLIDDFSSRQLNDTRHIAATARTWLNVLYPSHSPTGRNLVPVQVFPLTNSAGEVIGWERRTYEDSVTISSSRSQSEGLQTRN